MEIAKEDSFAARWVSNVSLPACEELRISEHAAWAQRVPLFLFCIQEISRRSAWRTGAEHAAALSGRRHIGYRRECGLLFRALRERRQPRRKSICLRAGA